MKRKNLKVVRWLVIGVHRIDGGMFLVHYRTRREARRSAAEWRGHSRTAVRRVEVEV